MGSFDLAAWTAPRRETLDRLLLGLFADAWPAPFTDMCLHPLRGRGKLIRPLLVVASFEAIAGEGAELSGVLPFAAALELIHTYSLVHDDMPCMDDDNFRRGRPTTHVLYGEAFGLLVGDALLTEAFRLASEPRIDPGLQLKVVFELARAAGYHGMIGGQAADLGAAGPVRDIETLTRLHAGKTGALIVAAARVGALVAGASERQLQLAADYAERVGLAFQLADDVLDLEQDAGEKGPPSFPKLLGVDETRARAEALSRQAMALAGELPWPDALVALAHYAVNRQD